MIFLIEYDRPKGILVTFKKYHKSQQSDAEDLRLEIELSLNRKGIDHEVVLLEAPSEEVLRWTHGSYFETADQILESLASGWK